MKQKAFRARKKHQKRRKRARLKAQAYERKELKYEELPKLAKKLVARKRRQQARSSV